MGVAILFFFASSRVARADVGLQLTLAPGVSWMRTAPSLTSGAVSGPREIGQAQVPTRGGLTTLGAYVDTELTFKGATTMPLFGLGYYSALGSYDSVTTSVDGSVARLQPWTTYRWDVLLPGLGGRWKSRRWMFELGARSGVSILGMHGYVATGADTHRIDPSGASFLLVGQASICRRLDPWQRICIEAQPRLFDFGFLNGGTAGFRWEWGM
jgi:hypothetical protein